MYQFGAEGHSVCACATLRSLMSVSVGLPLAATKIMAIDGGLRGKTFRVRVVICVVYLPCLTCRRCQKVEGRLRCLWQNPQQSTFE